MALSQKTYSTTNSKIGFARRINKKNGRLKKCKIDLVRLDFEAKTFFLVKILGIIKPFSVRKYSPISVNQ